MLEEFKKTNPYTEERPPAAAPPGNKDTAKKDERPAKPAAKTPAATKA